MINLVMKTPDPINNIVSIKKIIIKFPYFFSYSLTILVSSYNAPFMYYVFCDISFIITLSSTYLIIYDYNLSRVSWN